MHGLEEGAGRVWGQMEDPSTAAGTEQVFTSFQSILILNRESFSTWGTPAEPPIHV